jgi:SNF2 family DNA or RNA helicase
VVVIDESSRLKNQGTKRWTYMRRLVRRARYVVLLTGTPAPNGLHDLWSQIYLLDQGARLGHTVTSFRERWFEQNWGSAGWRALKHADEKIRARIEDICFTLRDSDYSDLPPRIDNFIKIKLDADLMGQYKRFQRDYILELEDGDKIKAVSAAALTNKLLQLSNGVVYDKDRNEKFFHKLKIEALREVIEEANGQPVFIAYNFKTDVKAIVEEFPHAIVLGNNPQTIKDWNDGRVPILVAHPKSAGHGLNLQHGGSIAVWYGLTWSLEDYQQFNKRLHRPGQTRTTVIHHLICEGTIDETVLTALTKKDGVQNSLLDSLRRIIQDVLEE